MYVDVDVDAYADEYVYVYAQEGPFELNIHSVRGVRCGPRPIDQPINQSINQSSIQPVLNWLIKRTGHEALGLIGERTK